MNKTIKNMIAVSIFTAATMQTSYAENRNIMLINNTSVPMIGLYASNIYRDTWEENMLQGRYLKAYSRINVDINDGSGACLFDVKAVYLDGTQVVEKQMNVCTKSYWRINGD